MIAKICTMNDQTRVISLQKNKRKISVGEVIHCSGLLGVKWVAGVNDHFA